MNTSIVNQRKIVDLTKRIEQLEEKMDTLYDPDADVRRRYRAPKSNNEQFLIDLMFEMQLTLFQRYKGSKLEGTEEQVVKWVQEYLRYKGVKLDINPNPFPAKYGKFLSIQTGGD